MFDALTKICEDVRRREEEAHRQAQEEGKDAITIALKTLFAQVPGLGKVQWNQFTPYFMDGDACVFGVNEICMISTKNMDLTDDDEDYNYDIDYCGELNKCQDRDWRKDTETFLPDNPFNATEEQYEFMKEFTKLMDGLSDVLERIFGDHVEISCARDGEVTIQDYDHE